MQTAVHHLNGSESYPIRIFSFITTCGSTPGGTQTARQKATVLVSEHDGLPCRRIANAAGWPTLTV